MRLLKGLLITILILLIVWVAFFVTDAYRVFSRHEKPVFCLAAATADDGGSGTYEGLGYSFKLGGNFLLPAPYVSEAELYVFGRLVHTMSGPMPYSADPAK